MPTIVTLRPDSTVAAGTQSPAGTGPPPTLWQAVSDNDVDTYTTSTQPVGDDQAMVLGVPSTSPAAGYLRHAVRARVEASAVSSTLATFGYVQDGTTKTVSVTPTANPAVYQQGWQYTAPTSGALSLGFVASLPDWRCIDAFIDVDYRAAPAFTPEVLDGAGNDEAGGTVTDTNIVTLTYGPVALDGLPWRGWEIQILDPSGATLFHRFAGTGAPPSTVPAVLGNGSYMARFTATSTVATSRPHPYTVDVLFDVAYTEIPWGPTNATVTTYDGDDWGVYVDVCWEEPPVSPWAVPDGVVAEIIREDCRGVHTVAVIEDGLSGCWTDRFVELSEPDRGHGCELASECYTMYRVRYWGVIDTATTAHTSPGDLLIPQGIIVAWPDSEASIPAGWSRVGVMDGRYPRGIATSTTNPGATGGAAVHWHETDPHGHLIRGHPHDPSVTTVDVTPAVTDAKDPWPPPFTSPRAWDWHAHTAVGATAIDQNVEGQQQAPDLSHTSNDVTRREVLFIESDGTPTGLPAGCWVMFNQQTLPDDWVSISGDTDTVNTSYLKGADGGTDGANTLIQVTDHTHTLDAHTHTPQGTHNHVGRVLSAAPFPAQAMPGGDLVSTAGHIHGVSFGYASPDATLSTAAAVSSVEWNDGNAPRYRRVDIIEATTAGTLPSGVICMWLGTLASIPSEWILCDGTHGTPDLIDVFPRYGPSAQGAPVTGGGDGPTHIHTGGVHHHQTTAHKHLATVGKATAVVAVDGFNPGNPGTAAAALHSHDSYWTDDNSFIPNTDERSPTIHPPQGDTDPPWIAVAYVMWIGTGHSIPPTVVTSSETYAGTPDTTNPRPGNDWVTHPTAVNQFGWPLKVGFCATDTYTRSRPFSRQQPISGGIPTVITGQPGGRDYTVQITLPERAIRDNAERGILEDILAAPYVYLQPAYMPGLFAAVNTESYTLTKVNGIVQARVTFVEVNPQPLPDPMTLVVWPAASP